MQYFLNSGGFLFPFTFWTSLTFLFNIPHPFFLIIYSKLFISFFFVRWAFFVSSLEKNTISVITFLVLSCFQNLFRFFFSFLYLSFFFPKVWFVLTMQMRYTFASDKIPVSSQEIRCHRLHRGKEKTHFIK